MKNTKRCEIAYDFHVRSKIKKLGSQDVKFMGQITRIGQTKKGNMLLNAKDKTNSFKGIVVFAKEKADTEREGIVVGDTVTITAKTFGSCIIAESIKPSDLPIVRKTEYDIPDLKCFRCGNEEGYFENGACGYIIRVGRGQYYCLKCFARNTPRLAEMMWHFLENARKKTWKCKRCGKEYKSNYALTNICDDCDEEGWGYIRNLHGKMELRNWNAFLKKLDENEKKVK